jgi:N6-adenosine-specific RNA methylase IME4
MWQAARQPGPLLPHMPGPIHAGMAPAARHGLARDMGADDPAMTPLPTGKYGTILADPPWDFEAWVDHGFTGQRSGKNYGSSRGPTYSTMRETELAALPIGELAAPDCVLFLWSCWPTIEQAFRLINVWGFKFKTCGFCWIKANATQIEMFEEEVTPDMLLGYWTRSNSEVCLLATRGRPKRLNADVRQAIIAPRREHSRKPEGIHDRIERLVAGPYLELFARQQRPGWTVWGDQVDKFAPPPPSPAWQEMWSRPFDFSHESEGNPG